MKKYLYLLMMLVCTSFVSCGGSDDDNDSGNSIGDASILNGTWYKLNDVGGFSSYEAWTFDNGRFAYLFREQSTVSGKKVTKASKSEGSYTVDAGSHLLKLTMHKSYESEDGINWKQATNSGSVSASLIYSIIDGKLTLTDSKGNSITYQREI